MTKNLSAYFPIIQTKEKILQKIKENPELEKIYYSWTKEQRKEFLDCCSGAKGFKLLYDSFFKEIFNVEYCAETMEDWLSSILKRKIKVLYALPNDSVRIADESSLLITDIVVQLEDGSIANVEMQKIGYLFPGERSACYSADLLLRQYKRIRDKKKKSFSYKDIKNVYTIILFEKSPREFRRFGKEYIHYFKQKSNTGMELNLIQEYIFVSLDLFKENREYKTLEDETAAWLLLFCEDEPEQIGRLIEKYPKFKYIYEIVYQMCLNVERVMNMFSEELRILDRNTVQLMIDELQKTIDMQKDAMKKSGNVIKEQRDEIEQLKKRIMQMEQGR
ncbi:MAG: PD-(D/E)XK nuclease family transposase [Lachnospiraceae bacterium]|nr:PD-(D/E)XK nuclease family transposase [Lachnospiraceae bacterium]